MLSKLARPTLARRSLMEFSWQSNYNVAVSKFLFFTSKSTSVIDRGNMRVKNFGWYGQIAMMMIAPVLVYKIPMTTCGQNFQVRFHSKILALLDIFLRSGDTRRHGNPTVSIESKIKNSHLPVRSLKRTQVHSIYWATVWLFTSNKFAPKYSLLIAEK